MNTKYLVNPGDKIKYLTRHRATMGCVSVVYDDGIKETKIFRNTPEKTCNVAMVDYLNELSLETKMNYIDHLTVSPDWRFRNDLNAEQLKLLNEWEQIHKNKTKCDICHEEINEYCSKCEETFKKDYNKFIPCQLCVKNKCNGKKVYDHCHLSGKY
ncbi:MAG: hypothetical protein ACK559_05305, partial [bacterium]